MKNKKINLIILLATGFYVGFFRFIPGTLGSFVAMVIYFVLKESITFLILPLVIFFLFSEKYIKTFFNSDDPPEAVIDEITGYFISIAFLPFSFKIAIMGFVIFRIVDIIKPFPIRQSEKLRFGILIDDILAGIMTNIMLRIILNFYHL